MSNNIDKIISEIPVIILAGGAGIKLGLNGAVIPKPMVEINGIPLLLYIMDHYGKAGVKKFIICGGCHLEMIKEFIDRLRSFDNKTNIKNRIERFATSTNFIDRTKWDIVVVDTGINSMTGSRLAQVRSMVDYSPTFCLTYGDTLSDVNLHALFLFHVTHKKTATLLAAHNPTRFRILGLCDNDDLVKGFSEKPVLERDYINGGFYIFSKSIFDLEKLSKDPHCVLETDVLEELVSKKELYAYRYNDFWQPLDNERDVHKIHKYLRNKIDKL